MDKAQARQGGTELGRFLRARRERTGPADVGLSARPGVRRTPGLRREELAMLAGVSPDYYRRLERGKESHPSPQVIDALARALRLGGLEHRHLRELAARAGCAKTAPTAPSRALPPAVPLMLERLRPYPAIVVSRVFDVLDANPSGLRMLIGIEDWPAEERNLARLLFLHPSTRRVCGDWEHLARRCVAGLRTLAGTEPDAPDLAGVVGELMAESPEFAKFWDRYEVEGHTFGDNTFHLPELGTIRVGYQGMVLQGTGGQRLIFSFAPPGGPDYDALVRLDAEAAEHLAPADLLHGDRLLRERDPDAPGRPGRELEVRRELVAMRPSSTRPSPAAWRPSAGPRRHRCSRGRGTSPPPGRRPAPSRMWPAPQSLSNRDDSETVSFVSIS
ncbi:helix-turn-helix transcriptional regulator [Glycomyces sp. L485]|uniref:helix-turn-helix transcriptional regulator n=1 Tax=Glycomyces sp. L485 TaxID=2909235 RepID=UPI001F4A4A50|nr:helix-turn-helix transcriptional regulator [Glycomyces sp. L485]MCH7231302.1 helix-turn-helix transcriptional regulator [Glycomyces sp. L485]